MEWAQRTSGPGSEQWSTMEPGWWHPCLYPRRKTMKEDGQWMEWRKWNGSLEKMDMNMAQDTE